MITGRSTQSIISFIVAMLLFSATGPVAAEETVVREYPLTGHGKIRLQVPASWKETVRQSPGGRPPTIVFTPQTGSGFMILFTPLYPVRAGTPPPSENDLQLLVQDSAVRANKQSVEKKLAIKKLNGGSVHGYYFSATDRAPRRGEYKYLTQGMLLIDEILPAFTVLTNDGNEDVVQQSLIMLKNVSHIKE